MIGNSKNSIENYPKKFFEHKKKKPGLSANRPSNNGALWSKYCLDNEDFQGVEATGDIA